jgi:hypothetical protein
MTVDIKKVCRYELSDPETVLSRLGLLPERPKRNSKGIFIPCPWHAENDASFHVRTHPGDGTLSGHCFGCGKTVDVFELIAHVHNLSLTNEFPQIIETAKALAGIQGLEGYKPPPAKKAPPPEFPDEQSLLHMTMNRVELHADPAAVKWATSRGYDVRRISRECYVLPKDMQLPEWAMLPKKPGRKQRTWNDTGHRLIIPLYDHDGRFRSVKARHIEGKSAIKNFNPRDRSCVGLCFANKIGQRILHGELFENCNIVFVEGETDFLMAVSRSTTGRIAIFGVYSGGWSNAHAVRVLRSTGNPKVVYLLDKDTAGDNYKKMIKKTFEAARENR